MTINDFTSHKKGINDFYKDNIPNTTDIVEAGKEPLKLRDIQKLTKPVTLPNGRFVNKAVALCIACVSSIDLRYMRKVMLSLEEKEFLADMMMQKYPHWSVTDLKCFELMLIGARLPSNKGGQTEYELTTVNIPNLLGKAEVYDKMRPTGTVYQGNSPKQEAEVKELDEWHKTHLLNHMEYDFAVPYENWVQGYTKPSGDPVRNAERYWRAPADYKNDEYDREAVDRIMAKVKGCVRTLSMADYLSTIRTSRGD